MYVKVSFVDLSHTIYVDHSLWKKSTTLKDFLDYKASPWSVDKIRVGGIDITEGSLNKTLSAFNGSRTILGEYEIEIEKHK